MSLSTQKPSASGWLLMLCMLLQGVSGIAGGIGLVTDPTGGNLQMPLSLLDGSPFNDFLIPGLTLLLVLGVYPLIVLCGLRARLSWVWPAALLVGPALIIWIVVEVLCIGYHPSPPLQLTYGLLGVVILVLTLSPSVRRYYRR